jgi:arylsulfatase A-like enzyme
LSGPARGLGRRHRRTSRQTRAPRHGLTRRDLLRRGGLGAAGAAGAGLLGAGAQPGAAAAQPEEDRPPSALLVVLPLLRQDHVEAFESGSPAKTPKLDELAGDSLRFDRAIPESMPALPARRALITGMRSYPFRDWRRTGGLAPLPGFNPIWDHQPIVTETLRAHGVETAYVSDNPILEGARWPDVVRAADVSASVPGAPGIDTDLIPAIRRQTKAAKASFAAGLRELERLADAAPFFLAIDPFDPRAAGDAPPVYVKPREVEDEGLGPMDGRLVELNWSDEDLEGVRSAYSDHVEAVDALVGALVERMEELELLDSTLLVAIGDQGIALGEHDYLGIATPTSHRPAYEVPFLIRHPAGEKAGDDVDWYATTHDVAPTILSFMDIAIPGKMGGEDLMALFDGVDEEDLYDRPFNVTAVGSNIIVRDTRWLMVADREEIERRMYDDDEEVEDDIKRYDDVANEDTGKLTELSQIALLVAGGTLPEFGPDGSLRPNVERGDDDSDDDGIPNDFDPIDNDEPEDGTEPGDLRFDGRIPEGGELPVGKRSKPRAR